MHWISPLLAFNAEGNTGPIVRQSMGVLAITKKRSVHTGTTKMMGPDTNNKKH